MQSKLETKENKILVIGSRGQMGRSLLKILGSRAVGVDSTQLDLTKTDLIVPNLENVKASAIINTAAYTLVDQAESEKEKCHLLNAVVPGVIAKYCFQKSIPFVHYSTDYVYSGKGDHFMTEEEPYGPYNHYGRTKLEGDLAVSKIGGKYLIFRICWVYDTTGRNFVNTVLKLASEHEEFTIVHDQFGAPSYAMDLAEATVRAIEQSQSSPAFPSGIYNLCNSGSTNWCDYASRIVEITKSLGVNLKAKRVLPKTTAEYITPAKRPRNSRLNADKIKNVFGIKLPQWDESLKICLAKKFGAYKSI